jgi:hypothetical protein
MRKDFLSTIEDKNLRKAVKKELKASQKETNEQKIEWLANDGDDTSMVEKSKLDNNHAKLQKAAKSTLLQTFRNMLTLSLFKEIN